MRLSNLRRFVSTCACATMVACGGGDGATPPTPPAPTPPVVTSVTVSPSALTLVLGAEQTVTATPLAGAQPVAGRTTTWASAAPNIATVSTGGIVRGVAPGSTIITASVDGQSGSTAVTVENPTPRLTSIAPSTIIAGTSSLTLTVAGLAFTAGTVVEWNGSAKPTTVVSATQLTTSLSSADLAQVGSFTVRVRTPAPGGGVTDSSLFTVTPIPVAAVVLASDTTSLVPGQTRTVVATVRDSLGRTLVGRSLVFSSSNVSVATVNAGSGVATAIAAGTASISVLVEGKSASTTLAVRPGALIGATGGVVMVGSTTVSIPANAVAANTAFTIDSLASPPAATGLLPFSAVQLGPSGVNFLSPVTVTMRWTAAQLPAGADPSTFAVHRYNGSAWVPLADRVVDVAARTVRGTTSGFSPFAIVQLPPPSLSPDELLFIRTSDNAVCALNVNTRAVRTIIATASETPALSLDRRTIAYVRRVGNFGQIMVADFDGQNVRPLTTGQQNDASPSFSADGARVFFARDLSGVGNWKVMSLNVASGATTQHTFPSNGTLPNDFTPVVDGASTRIAMARSTLGGALQITTTTLTGTQPIDLTPLSASTPMYSPNGLRMAYIDTRTSGVARITTINTDGSNQVVLTSVTGTAGGITWSPDGTQIAFHALNATTGFVFQLFKVNVDGSGLTQLTSNAQSPAYFPRWSRN
ncbi:MAG: PD40 domain-containing protein [Gemmatimonadaceae bacterium]|nr:PD40 domain-containing protein [Gemmatimonadaceae bacterium]